MPLVLVGWRVFDLSFRDATRNDNSGWARQMTMAAGIVAVVYELANIAVFDRVSTTAEGSLNSSTFVTAPRVYPWLPGEHFFVLYVRQFGAASALAAVFWTLGQFLMIAAAAIFALRPFCIPDAMSESPSPQSLASER